MPHPRNLASAFSKPRKTLVGEDYALLLTLLEQAVDSGHLNNASENFLSDSIERLSKFLDTTYFTLPQQKWINSCLTKAQLDEWDWPEEPTA